MTFCLLNSSPAESRCNSMCSLNSNSPMHNTVHLHWKWICKGIHKEILVGVWHWRGCWLKTFQMDVYGVRGRSALPWWRDALPCTPQPSQPVSQHGRGCQTLTQQSWCPTPAPGASNPALEWPNDVKSHLGEGQGLFKVEHATTTCIDYTHLVSLPAEQHWSQEW